MPSLEILFPQLHTKFFGAQGQTCSLNIFVYSEILTESILNTAENST